MATTALDVVLKEIENRRDIVAHALIDGSATDYAAYKQMCGEIRGLSLAHTYVTDLVRKIESGDDDE